MIHSDVTLLWHLLSTLLIGSLNVSRFYFSPSLNFIFFFWTIGDLIASLFFQRLYRLGARKIIMFEIGPIGCIPSITKHSGECVEATNQLATYFNERLPAMLINLTLSLQGSSFVLGQGNWLGYNAIKNPSSYGKLNFMCQSLSRTKILRFLTNFLATC